MELRILAGTERGLFALGGLRTEFLAGRGVATLVRDGRRWLAIVDGHEVWSQYGNGRWDMLATLQGLKFNCLLPTADGLLVGTSEAHVYRLVGKELQTVASFDTTRGRDSWYTPWGGLPDVRSMSVDASGALFANVHVGGIPCSTDQGRTWQPTIEVDADVHQVLSDHASGLLLAASARGLGVSSNGGHSWRFDTVGIHGRYMRAVAVSGETVVVTASMGHNSNRAALYRRSVGSDGPFEKCEVGLPEWFGQNIDTFCLAGLGSAFAFGTDDGQVFASSDGGEIWALVAEGLPPVRCLALQ